MRSWESRPDTAVSDEPLYGVYLAATGLAHPDREAVVGALPTDWREVAEALSGPAPDGAAVWFQKHMAHHLLPHVGRGWLDDSSFRHAFLIRDPAAVAVSLDRVTPDPTLEDMGLPQQLELFERTRDRTGETPPVIDADDLLRDPPGVLSALCARLGLAFDPAMLAWAPGPRASDGVWAEHWYASVWKTTGFGPFAPREVVVPDRLRPLVEAARPLYEALTGGRLVGTGPG